MHDKHSSMELDVEGVYRGKVFEMNSCRNATRRGVTYRPYQIKQGEGSEKYAIEDVCQTEFKQGLFKKYDFCRMMLKGFDYNLYGIAFGSDGSKCPVSHGDAQVTQVEKGSVTHNGLHSYKIYAIDEYAGFITLIFGIYMCITSGYAPGKKEKRLVERVYSLTKNKLLLKKYNSHFIENILD